MRILALSDQVVDAIYSARARELFGDVGLLLSCGDLPYSYLEYVVTMLSKPAFYVHGNHDQPEYMASGKTLTEPGGWVNLDRRVTRTDSLLLAGLEGAVRYKPFAPFQYSQAEMWAKVLRLAPRLLHVRLRYGRYLDIMVTHAPPYGIHTGEDRPHQGFRAFSWLIDRFQPRYFLHGHKHAYRPQATRTLRGATTVINVYPSALIEVDTAERAGSPPPAEGT